MVTREGVNHSFKIIYFYVQFVQLQKTVQKEYNSHISNTSKI